MMPDETAQAADDLRARAVLAWDDSFWRNTAGMNRINGWRLPAKEGRLLTPVQGEPVWVADKTQSFNAVALSASAVSEERAYDDFRSGD